MIDGYPYIALMVTGILHSLLGATAAIAAVIGMVNIQYEGRSLRIYCAVALFTANLVLMVGSLGTSAGRRRFSDSKTRRLKIAYMVTAILSAVIFSWIGMSMFVTLVTVARHLDEDWAYLIPVGQVGSIAMALEFLLAIVSSSICCCCANTNTYTTVVIQAPMGQPYPVGQYRAAPEAYPTAQYQAPPEVYPTTQYQSQPGAYPTGKYQPPPEAYPTVQYQPPPDYHVGGAPIEKV